ncbi:MAG: hypothetical protein WBG95_05315 [Sulfitobacter sp.]
MKQIMTGPFGRVAYHGAAEQAEFPALSVPCCAFAQGRGMMPANENHGPNIIAMPRRSRAGAALAMFGAPDKRTPALREY